MKTFREYLEGREVNESFLRNAALGLGAAAAMGLGGNIQAQTPDQKALASITKKIDQEDDAHNEIKKLKDGAYNRLLMKTNLTDDEKVFMDWMENLIRRNTSVALDILKEKHITDGNFNEKLDLNDPVVKFVFKTHPEFKKAMQEGGKDWMQRAMSDYYDTRVRRERNPLSRFVHDPAMMDILRKAVDRQ